VLTGWFQGPCKFAGEWVGGDFASAGRPRQRGRAQAIHSPAVCAAGGVPAIAANDPNRPEDVLTVDADEDGVGGDDAADCLRYMVATKTRSVVTRKLRGL
jgi:hypothetical protein